MTEHQGALFLTVVEAGSFSKAEEKAYISKQAIIKQINLLEQDIGVPLLIRTAHGVTPTAAGSALYDGLTTLTAMHENLIRKVRGMGAQPTIRLASVEHHVLISAAEGEFFRQNPKIQLQHNTFSNVKELELLRAGLIDIAETRAPTRRPETPFRFTPLVSMTYVCLMNPDHPLAMRPCITPEELRGMQIVVDENPGECLFFDRLQALCGEQCRLIGQSESNVRKISLLHDAYATGAVCITPSPVVRAWAEPAVIPFDVPYRKRYGITYAADAPGHILQFVQYLADYYQCHPQI